MLSIPRPRATQPQEVGPVLWPVPAQLVFNPGAGYHDHGTANANVAPVGAAAILPWNGELAAKVGSSAGADRVEFGSPPALNSQAFSGLIRFYQTTTSQAFLIETGGGACFEISVSGTSVSINRSNVSVVIASSNAPVLNAWNIVSFSINRATNRHRVALNGILTTGSTVASTFNNFGTVQTGKWSGSLGQLHYTSCLILANQEVFDDAFLTKVTRSAQEVWGLFAPRSTPVPESAGGGTDGNASTAPASSTLTAPTATGSGSAQASTAPAGSTLTAPTATASASAQASGALAGLTLTAPTGTATGTAADGYASGEIAGLSLGAPTATASNGEAQIQGGGWAAFAEIEKRRRKQQDPEEVMAQALESVVSAPRKTITMASLVGKRAAAEIEQRAMSETLTISRKRKRKRDDEFLLLM